jgi:hypothetical protein
MGNPLNGGVRRNAGLGLQIARCVPLETEAGFRRMNMRLFDSGETPLDMSLSSPAASAGAQVQFSLKCSGRLPEYETNDFSVIHY